jgi:hypothetical protein
MNIQIPEFLEKYPMTSYFLETKHNWDFKSFSAYKWIKWLDSDTFNMLLQYVRKIEALEKLSDEELENNKDPDIDDFCFLAFYIIAHESNMSVEELTQVTDEKKLNEYGFCLFVLVNIESLRKKGWVTIENPEAKLIDFGTKRDLIIKATEKGKKEFNTQ